MRPMRHWSRKSMLLALPLLALAFVGLNWLSGSTLRGARLVLTQLRLYTCSPGTLRILDRGPEPFSLQL
jgi:ABC-type uncharacterized transport system involved in gliding motility auxiliary subunit